MTPKELLYLEDSLGMEQHLETKCKNYAEKIQDPELKALLNEFVQDHQCRFNNLMQSLNG